MKRAIVSCVIAFLATGQCLAAELAVISIGAVRAPFNICAGAWEEATGNKVRASFDPAGEVRKKLAAGEIADVLIMPADALAALEKDGRVVAGSKRDLGAVAMGAAVKKGAPLPDISTPEALKRALLAAKSVTYMDPERGTSGKHFDEFVLPRLGIRDAVRAKATLGEGGSTADKVARGEAEIAFQNLSELMTVEGVTVVGLLPAQLQRPIVYSGAVMKSAQHPREAQALLDYLSTEGRKAFLDRGFTAP